MNLGRKILSYLLLASYSLVVLHTSIVHAHGLSQDSIPLDIVTHDHGEFEHFHHEHNFHIGLFHFLGHLLDTVDHTDDHSDEHLCSVQNVPVKSTFETSLQNHIGRIEARDLLDQQDGFYFTSPPYHLLLLQELIFSKASMRAPPVQI